MPDTPFDEPRIPVATYRVQFHGEFGFSDARQIVPYLRELGISDLYASPCFRAKKGSRHGYDIVDPNALNPEVGSEEEFEALIAELRRCGMGLILDIVPNHMGIESPENLWWMDLLENGSSSPHADFFDVDWEPVKKELKNKVLSPILGDQYGAVLERGELVLAFEEGAFSLRYYDHRLPIRTKSSSAILTCRLEELEAALSADHPDYQELLSIDTALRNLPPPTEDDPKRIAERFREKEVVRRRLGALYGKSPEIRRFIDENIALFNGEPGDAESFDHLDELLRRQVYRLSHWRVATEEINYRRFFDINGLAALRVENPQVFAETHRLIFRLIREGKVTGLRVDHLDGLYDPADYLGQLQRGCYLQRGLAVLENAAGKSLSGAAEEEGTARLLRDWTERIGREPAFKPFYLIGEKILLKGEKLPEEWPVFNTTGYEFANLVNGLFVETGNARAFDALYERFIRSAMNFPDIAYEKKKLVMQATMSGEINTLGHRLNAISEVNRHTRDFTLNSLIKALVEVIAFFPVYRTYTGADGVADRDRRYVEFAIARAKRKNPATDPSVFDFVRKVLLLDLYAGAPERQRGEWLDFVRRFQQLSGPVTAKGVEDTAFYVYNRLVSLNEVGGSPERFGLPLEAFHGQNIERGRSHPQALLATSTHDTKRGEDVRGRINVLSEIPEAFRDALARWRRLNKKKKTLVDGQPAPDPNEEYLLYQTLVGTWPTAPATAEEFFAFRQRIRDYMRKAVREAKVNSSWIRPNEAYEEALLSFVDLLLQDHPGNLFLADLGAFQVLTSRCGMFNALSQTLLKMTAPGLPDFYQGSELWDLSLVDPDNRRPVDFALRRRHLEELGKREKEEGLLRLARELGETMGDGRIKLFLIRQALGLRRARRRLFEEGSYLPLEVRGERSDHVCAFARREGEREVIVVAPRLFTRLLQNPADLPLGQRVWEKTCLVLPAGEEERYRNVFTGEISPSRPQGDLRVLLLSELLADFPVALLERI
ncbi:maltooligosyl trehalose synthase [Desulfuromonas soudanensis]|uniref:Maltooligosyl trehalose synthase n=1 Tax=Desulfuromonas soudanensis TaxID=1603606 RepID=A0A0M3QF26_9BACT|nr:malto-oligosyltrehalose synthase [Desulfuromonas soudanensis]ALC15343.1 maltooligosyl trehalose synthase [Desulfuromonas soudanensis]